MDNFKLLGVDLQCSATGSRNYNNVRTKLGLDRIYESTVKHLDRIECWFGMSNILIYQG
jgi:hypothetical protein